MTEDFERLLHRLLQEQERRKVLGTPVTYGMLGEDFRSLPGIPDNFQSAEDPADRRELWNTAQRERRQYTRSSGCGRCDCGWCSSCDPEYKD